MTTPATVPERCAECGLYAPIEGDDICWQCATQHDVSLNGETSYAPGAADATVHTPPPLASEPHILDRFTDDLHSCGVVGEDRNGKLIYLALTSAVLDDPVSLALKGVSSSGKSYTVEAAMRFFPPACLIEMTAMSERALVYMKDDFAHRTIVLFEAVALREERERKDSNLTSYFVRSLLSEGRISYPVTTRDKDGNFTTRTITKTGPTNLIVTTTSTSLHSENETRLISLPTNDSADQTRAVLLELASGPGASLDLTEWRALQTWIRERGERRVVVPYARYLAENIPPVAVRLRRDFKSILRLIAAHAILHQRSRDRDDQGRIIAAEEDYLVVRELVADLIAEGVGATVSPTIRETVEAVRRLTGPLPGGVSVQALAAELGLDRSTASRRTRAAKERGYLVNLEDRRGRPARYQVGEPLPEEVQLLPIRTTPEAETAGEEGVCSDAASVAGEGDGVGSTTNPYPKLEGDGTASLYAQDNHRTTAHPTEDRCPECGGEAGHTLSCPHSPYAEVSL